MLVADHSPLIAAFLHNTFIVSNQRRLSRADLASALEDPWMTRLSWKTNASCR
jgi:hypothetical protein